MQNEVLATKREKTGSAEARRLRKAGKLPAVIYNNKGESKLIQVVMHDFERMLHHHTSENLIVDVVVDGQPLGKALLKEVQHDPVTGSLVHVDLVEISMTQKLRVNIAITPVGQPVGVEAGGIMEQVLRYLEVECLPADLVEDFKVDVGHLKIGDSLLVRDLTVGEKYHVLTNGALAVIAVAQPKEEEEATPEAAAAAEGAAEPEVIAKGKKEEEGEGAEGAAPDAKGAKGGKEAAGAAKGGEAKPAAAKGGKEAAGAAKGGKKG
ncbi:MAG: 50S ribosomal protein L25 [Lentisphaerae bacterium]|nr:50S ribosomal protein L25 [Lentisphaerota bacterium]